MRGAEIDVTGGIWTIPGGRMKGAKEHRVPLVGTAIACLGGLSAPDGFVFPSPSDQSKPMSDMSLTAVLKKMNRDDITVHGFRSAFRDWAGETTNVSREVIEAALAHRLKDKAEAAYARGDLFDKRRHLMMAWAKFASGLAA